MTPGTDSAYAPGMRRIMDHAPVHCSGCTMSDEPVHTHCGACGVTVNRSPAFGVVFYECEMCGAFDVLLPEEDHPALRPKRQHKR